MKNGQFFPILTFLLLVHSTLSAQLVGQPDPLRPSVADSTQVSPSDSTGATSDDPQSEDSTASDYRYRFAADGTVTTGNVSRALLQLSGAVDYELSHYFKLSSTPSFVYGKQNGLLAEREWFGDLRTTFRYEKRLYYLAFGSYERSNLRQIDKRWTIAGGIGYKLLNRKKTYISITNVILHENTDFSERDDINIVRNSTRLYGEYTFDHDRLTITHTTFYQPAIGQNNIRWNASLSLQIKLTEVLSLRSTLANAYESLIAPGRQNNDLRFTVGVVYEKK